MVNWEKLTSFYKNKTIIVTGHTGFKGSWLSIWLQELGAQVIGVSLEPFTKKDNFVLSHLSEKITDLRVDIRDRQEIDKIFETYQPDILFHLAAQAIVRESYTNPIFTYETNLMGTINLLEAFRECSTCKSGVFITTDKCYENKEQIWGYRESDPLGGYDPYSSSKACAEIAINSWRRSFLNITDKTPHQKAIASARAGNVIGGGDWAKDRIVPDCIRAIESDQPIIIRNPSAIRPWQHVLEPLYGYLLLGYYLWHNPDDFNSAWNFGPNYTTHLTVWNLAQKIIQQYGQGELKDGSNPAQLHESNLLLLEISKAIQKLGWKPLLDIDDTVKLTVEWYKKYTLMDVYQICKEQIQYYQNLISLNDIK